MRSTHAYTLAADALATEVAEIEAYRPDWTEDEMISSLETAREIAIKLADAFESANPAGFDRQRFLTDAGVNTL
jgi:hypothetical protein